MKQQKLIKGPEKNIDLSKVGDNKLIIFFRK